MVPGYMSGFGNSFETEALAGALPVGRNSPQKVNYGLYAEQLSGSPFTAPQASNQRSWLYRIRPTVRHTGRFQRVDMGTLRTAPAREDADLPIGQLRWSPTPLPDAKLTFVTGLPPSPPRATPRAWPAWRAISRSSPSRWSASTSSTPTASC